MNHVNHAFPKSFFLHLCSGTDLSNRRSLLDKSCSTFNETHSSLMTRSLVSNAVSVDKPDPIHIIKSKLMNKRVILNVGGERHEVDGK